MLTLIRGPPLLPRFSISTAHAALMVGQLSNVTVIADGELCHLLDGAANPWALESISVWGWDTGADWWTAVSIFPLIFGWLAFLLGPD